MRADKEYVERKFREFNRQMFGGRLPELPIRLTDVGGALGKCCFMAHRLADGRMEYSNFSLEINTRIDLPENVVEDVIIHEMIHYFIGYHNLNDTSSHGEVFKSLMHSINTTHGRKISISHKLTADEREQAVSTKRVWHVIAAVYLKSGKTGVKVLPRTVNKVLDYYNHIGGLRDIDRIELYLHDNPFFNRFPTSGAFRIHPLDSNILEENLVGARKLRVNGKQIVESGRYGV